MFQRIAAELIVTAMDMFGGRARSTFDVLRGHASLKRKASKNAPFPSKRLFVFRAHSQQRLASGPVSRESDFSSSVRASL